MIGIGVGYKLTTINKKELFIITLMYYNDFPDEIHKTISSIYLGGAFYTTDCVIESIINLNTGKNVDEVTGSYEKKRRYFSGEVIKNERIYFVKDKSIIFKCMVFESLDGRFYLYGTEDYLKAINRTTRAYEKLNNNPFACYCDGQTRKEMLLNYYFQSP